MHTDPADPLVLPDEPSPPSKRALPMAGAVVPVISGVVLWLVTGSLFALCFAALGPAMMGASLIDSRRQRRREQRESAREYEEAWRRTTRQWQQHQQREQDTRLREAPDAALCLADPPLRGMLLDASTVVTVARGTDRSRIRLSGGTGERAEKFREQAATITGVPLVVSLGSGIAIRGCGAVTQAVLRAIVAQLCLRFGVRALAVIGEPEHLEQWGIHALPHAAHARSGVWRVGVSAGAIIGRADSSIVLLDEDDKVPEGVSVVIDCNDPTSAVIRHGEQTMRGEVEGISRQQIAVLAQQLARHDDGVVAMPERIALHELDQPALYSDGLLAAIGGDGAHTAAVDLVEDGPHAIVTGVTGAGKSELLVSWVSALATAYSPEQLHFVLADFKGGTAFDPLKQLPHVAAVMTDLDAEEAERGVHSLRAELRRREQHLADRGARSIADPKSELARLVIIVDEFAALLNEHPTLAEVFTDIAARGRALGMHLIIGTQRATGVVRDALAANCPLRITLRVTDAADSRLMIGSDAAAELSGESGARGLALMRRPRDAEPVLFRVALTAESDLRRIAAQYPDATRATSPWQPPLPTEVTLAQLRAAARGPGHGGESQIHLALIDDPQRQRRDVLSITPGRDRGMMIVGGAASGKTTAVQMLVDQYPHTLVIPADEEQAWSIVHELAAGERPAAPLIVCDDMDARLAAFPPEYSQVWVENWERIVRSAGAWGSTIVCTATRLSGGTTKVADLLPRRALLALPNRHDHVAAGGDSAQYIPHRPAGRLSIDGYFAQVAYPDTDHRARSHPTPASPTNEPAWQPSARLTVVITQRQELTAAALRQAWPQHPVLTLTDVLAQHDPLAFTPQTGPDLPAGAIIVGEAEGWQRSWQLWQHARGVADIVVLPECTTELRTLVGWRGLAPYLRPHAGRAWLVTGGQDPQRIVIAALAPQLTAPAETAAWARHEWA